MDYPSSPRFQKTRTSPSSGYTSTTRSPPRYSAYSSAYSSSTTSPEIPTIKYFTPLAVSSKEYESPYAKGEDLPAGRQVPSSSRQLSRSTGIAPFIGSTSDVSAISQHTSTMSTYSSSSRGSSSYSSPGPRQHKIAASMASSSRSASQTISANDKEQMLKSLRTHRVNTLTELRRIEKLLAANGNTPKEINEALTTAWAHYVNSNNLLSELRGLTKNYPFSSECLDEAKWQVIGDPNSTKSWNYAWLILKKIRDEGLIRKHARQQAAKPVMWGGKNPTTSGVEKLTQACVAEWTRALEQMLRQWSSPPHSGK